jgi:NO-binding membrane sensor protein with MHYT domain
MPKTYDPFLVALSVLIAVWASYDALLLAGRVKVARGTARPIWLIAGSFAMGIGIWSMHFVGMLALRLPVAVSYDVALVTLSVVMAISSAAVAFTLVSWEVVSTGSFLAGAICMGLAISGMHYTGMAAMRLPALMWYDDLVPFVPRRRSLWCLARSTRWSWWSRSRPERRTMCSRIGWNVSLRRSGLRWHCGSRSNA